MQAPGTVLIFAQTMPHGSRLLERGDRYDQQALGFDDFLHRSLLRTKAVVDLTPESYAAQMVYRPPGTVGRGFTAEWLLEHGIISAQAADEAKVLPPGKTAYKGYVVVRHQVGIQVLWGVENKVGEPMREKRFQSIERATKFIDTLPPVEDQADGRDVQSGAHATA